MHDLFWYPQNHWYSYFIIETDFLGIKVSGFCFRDWWRRSSLYIWMTSTFFYLFHPSNFFHSFGFCLGKLLKSSFLCWIFSMGWLAVFNRDLILFNLSYMNIEFCPWKTFLSVGCICLLSWGFVSFLKNFSAIFLNFVLINLHIV
jgi:hypothetical protein